MFYCTNAGNQKCNIEHGKSQGQQSLAQQAKAAKLHWIHCFEAQGLPLLSSAAGEIGSQQRHNRVLHEVQQARRP